MVLENLSKAVGNKFDRFEFNQLFTNDLANHIHVLEILFITSVPDTTVCLHQINRLKVLYNVFDLGIDNTILPIDKVQHLIRLSIRMLKHGPSTEEIVNMGLWWVQKRWLLDLLFKVFDSYFYRKPESFGPVEWGELVEHCASILENHDVLDPNEFLINTAAMIIRYDIIDGAKGVCLNEGFEWVMFKLLCKFGPDEEFWTRDPVGFYSGRHMDLMMPTQLAELRVSVLEKVSVKSIRSILCETYALPVIISAIRKQLNCVSATRPCAGMTGYARFIEKVRVEVNEVYPDEFYEKVREMWENRNDKARYAKSADRDGSHEIALARRIPAWQRLIETVTARRNGTELETALGIMCMIMERLFKAKRSNLILSDSFILSQVVPLLTYESRYVQARAMRLISYWLELPWAQQDYGNATILEILTPLLRHIRNVYCDLPVHLEAIRCVYQMIQVGGRRFSRIMVENLIMKSEDQVTLCKQIIKILRQAPIEHYGLVIVKKIVRNSDKLEGSYADLIRALINTLNEVVISADDYVELVLEEALNCIEPLVLECRGEGSLTQQLEDQIIEIVNLVQGKLVELFNLTPEEMERYKAAIFISENYSRPASRLVANWPRMD